MLEQQVCLTFHCCACDSRVEVTVKCSGIGMAAGPRTTATVKVPCPTCTTVNQLYFQPCGAVRAVELCPSPNTIPEPSMN